VVVVHERDRDHARPAEDLAHAFEQPRARRLHAPPVVHDARDAGRFDRRGDRARFVEIGRQRLLTEHVQALPRGGDRDLGVRRDGTRDVHRLEAGVGEQLVDVRRAELE